MSADCAADTITHMISLFTTAILMETFHTLAPRVMIAIKGIFVNNTCMH